MKRIKAAESGKIVIEMLTALDSFGIYGHQSNKNIYDSGEYQI